MVVLLFPEMKAKKYRQASSSVRKARSPLFFPRSL